MPIALNIAAYSNVISHHHDMAPPFMIGAQVVARAHIVSKVTATSFAETYAPWWPSAHCSLHIAAPPNFAAHLVVFPADMFIARDVLTIILCVALRYPTIVACEVPLDALTSFRDILLLVFRWGQMGAL